MSINRAIFIDRDGVINCDFGYVFKWEDFKFIDGSVEGLRLLCSAGFLLFIITNQSGIGRGYYTDDDFSKLNIQMLNCLHMKGVNIRAVYHCPHSPGENCICRKPSPEMILRAKRDHDVDLRHSYMIGDKLSDIEAGQRAEVGTQILVGHDVAPANARLAEFVRADNLFEAAKQIVHYISE